MGTDRYTALFRVQNNCLHDLEGLGTTVEMFCV